MSTKAVENVLNEAREKKAKKQSLQFPLLKYKRKTGSDGATIIEGVNFQQSGFLSFLSENGFRRYDIPEAFVLVRIQDNIIEQVQNYQVREFAMRYFRALDPWPYECTKEQFIEQLYRSFASLTSDEKLSLLVDFGDSETSIKLVEDTIDKAYYFYQNGFVEVTKSGWELRPYKDLPGYVWKDQILPRDFAPMRLAEIETGVYWQFANNIANNKELEDGSRNDPERFASFVTITGYNLHRFFETKLKSTVFLDARQTDVPDGRSGKSLHCKAMRYILNEHPLNGKQCKIIDGKKFDSNNRFSLDELHMSTRLVVFDDIKRGFQIEDFFNAILDGLVSEKKGDKKERVLAKIIFTLNYTLRIQGGSAKDRVIEFEIADYYSSKFQPTDEFKHWFFRDWSPEEWGKFDNFMMLCVSEYLKTGVIMPDTLNLEARKLKDETAPEFIAFMQDLNIAHEQRFDKKELFIQFADVGEDGKIRNTDFHWIKQRVFTQWLRLWATYRPEMAGYKEQRSSGNDYIIFFWNEPVLEKNLKDAVLFPEKSNKVTIRPEDENGL